MPPSRTARPFPVLFAASAVWLAAPGCDAQPRGTSTDARTVPTAATPAHTGPEAAVVNAPQAQKPDLTRLDYDPGTRTLTVYELPERSARWMLTTPTAPTGVPVDREYQFPPNMDLDLDQVAVYYTVPNRRPSPTVSLREILDARVLR